jgi:acyl carrier protein
MKSKVEETVNGEGVESRVLEILKRGLEVEVTADTDVIQQGLLDSLNFVDVMLRLEAVFSVQIDVEQVELDDFRSARSITEYLSRQHQIA